MQNTNTPPKLLDQVCDRIRVKCVGWVGKPSAFDARLADKLGFVPQPRLAYLLIGKVDLVDQ